MILFGKRLRWTKSTQKCKFLAGVPWKWLAVQNLMDCPQSFMHQKIRKGWNMPIYFHFWSKSEYQYEKNCIKHVAFSALSKNVSTPFQWQSPGAVRGGLSDKVTQVLLRQKVMLCYDKNRFLNSCMLFEIFRWQNVNFMVKNGKKYCIFRPELPPLVLSAGLHQKPNKCHSK